MKFGDVLKVGDLVRITATTGVSEEVVECNYGKVGKVKSFWDDGTVCVWFGPEVKVRTQIVKTWDYATGKFLKVCADVNYLHLDVSEFEIYVPDVALDSRSSGWEVT